MSDWGVIGDGPWGMSLAKRLAKSNHYVRIGGLDEHASKLPKGIEHTTDLGDIVRRCERLIFAVSIAEFEAMLRQVSPHLGGSIASSALRVA